MQQDLKARLDAIPSWWHSIDLGEVVTPGHKKPAALRAEWDAMHLPDLHGKTVLDIGAFDGYFSFEAEKSGASRVMAVDYFTWSWDWNGYTTYLRECKQKGETPKRLEETPFYYPDTLPGRRGFDLAREVLQSRVEPIFGDYMMTAVEPADIVFYLGVLYHMEDPLAALKRVASLTKELAIIETHAIHVEGLEDVALCEFYEFDELSDDMTNWWGPNQKALVGLCRAAGFRGVQLVSPEVKATHPNRSLYQKIHTAGGHVLRKFSLLTPYPRKHYFRAVVQAWK